MAKKLTQEQLAEKANISRRYLQMIEAGTYTPTVKVAAGLRKGLGCSWEILFKGM
jgi:transcriptional regulator with XRE-family HTH domain